MSVCSATEHCEDMDFRRTGRFMNDHQDIEDYQVLS